MSIVPSCTCLLRSFPKYYPTQNFFGLLEDRSFWNKSQRNIFGLHELQTHVWPRITFVEGAQILFFSSFCIGTCANGFPFQRKCKSKHTLLLFSLFLNPCFLCSCSLSVLFCFIYSEGLLL